MDKLLKISSAEYDKAESLAVLHAIVIPVVMSFFAFFIEPKATLLGGIIYTALMIVLNVVRSYFTHSPFEKEKTRMYFNLLSYTIAAFFVAMLILAALIVG